MRETYFIELLMNMVRAGMKAPVFKLTDGMELKVYSHHIELATPIYNPVDCGNAGIHEELVNYQRLDLTADQLFGMMGVAYGLCMSVSELERGEKG